MRPTRSRTTLNSAKTASVQSVLTGAEKKQETRKLLVHEKVEVRSTQEGLRGSWHSGEVVEFKDDVRHIIYDEIVNDRGLDMVEDVRVSTVLDGFAYADSLYIRGKIRPLPSPPDLAKECIRYGLCVDVRFKDAAGWWEGVVFDHDVSSDERRVFLPDTGDEKTAKVDALRITRDWDEASGEWRFRGKWPFLQILKEVASFWPLAASPSQIWFDIQLKGWVDWTHPSRDFWKSVTRSALKSSYDLLMRQIVEELTPPGNEDLMSDPEDEGVSMSEMADESAYPLVSFPSILGQGNVPVPVKLELPKPENDGLIALHTVPKEGEEDMVEVEKVFCPRAVLEYTQNESGGKKADEGEEPLILKAKKHLSAEGWRFHYIKKRWNDKEKSELRYVSPDGKKKFSSLITACRGYIEHKPSSLNTRKMVHRTARNQPKLSPFKWFSPLILNEPKQVNGSSEKAGSVKAEVEEKVELFVAPQGRRTLARLIDANVVLPGAKVQYRSKAGVSMQEGRISREGIICCCCDQVFTLSGFEVHAGSTNKRPSAHTFLEDGRSIAVCSSLLK